MLIIIDSGEEVKDFVKLTTMRTATMAMIFDIFQPEI